VNKLSNVERREQSRKVWFITFQLASSDVSQGRCASAHTILEAPRPDWKHRGNIYCQSRYWQFFNKYWQTGTSLTRSIFIVNIFSWCWTTLKQRMIIMSSREKACLAICWFLLLDRHLWRGGESEIGYWKDVHFHTWNCRMKYVSLNQNTFITTFEQLFF
jgi:hypothetical protein